MLIVALVYWGKVINNLVIFWNVKNLKYKMQKQPSTGVLKKGIMDFFFLKKQKIKNLKNGQSHWKTLRYILLKISSSISISQEYFPRSQEDLFSRTAVGGRFQILKYKKKNYLRNYFSKTTLFVKNFKINHEKLIIKAKILKN